MPTEHVGLADRMQSRIGGSNDATGGHGSVTVAAKVAKVRTLPVRRRTWHVALGTGRIGQTRAVSTWPAGTAIRPQRRARSHQTAVRRTVLVIGFIVLAVAMRQVTPHSFTHTLPGAGDPDFNVWVMGWVAHNLFHPAHLFNANDFWPHKLTLAYSDDLITVAPVFGVVRLVSGNEQAAAGTVDLLLVVVSLAATYALVRWLLGSGLAAILAALAFTFNAYTQTHVLQVQLESVGLLSLAFLTLFSTFEHQRLRDGAALGVATALVTLTSPYYGSAWALSAVVCLIGWLIWRRTITARLIAALALGAVITGIVVGPAIYEYRNAGSAAGLSRPLVSAFAFHIRDLLTPAAGNWLYGTRIAALGNGPGESSLFPGFVVLALALVGVITLIRRPPTLGRHSIGATFASFGSRSSRGGPARGRGSLGSGPLGSGSLGGGSGRWAAAGAEAHQERRGYVVLLAASASWP